VVAGHVHLETSNGKRRPPAVGRARTDQPRTERLRARGSAALRALQCGPVWVSVLCPHHGAL